ncbi:hypothetical protein A9Q83_13620 [Alphaproteobacteria bacterium 46_93_T64]|mgnify:CR=1 FL=1|nr:hypothetical protein A9Q83_13620 [Alphaproteobacteria bacterium 46_93_T64]
MSYLKIKAALETHLQVFGADNIVFGSVKHTLKNGQSYLAPTFIPGKVKTVLLGPKMPKERTGFFQINVHEISDHAGITKVDALCAHFEQGQLLNFDGLDVHLGKTELKTDKSNLNHTNIPMTIAWRSYF